MNKRVVIALGGNALIKKGQKGTIYEQFANTRESCKSIVKIVKSNWDVVMTHGNGPQVGALLLQNQAAKNITPAMPLGICVAESEGLIGYMIQQCLSNALKKGDIEKHVISIITQVIIDKDDPCLNNPTKPIGPYYTKEESEDLINQGYKITKQPRGFRIVVPSPDPKKIVEGEVIKKMLDDGILVIASGGGGMPVIEKEDWGLDGIEAVVDKDLTAEKLAETVGAEVLLILTDEEKVYLNYNKSNQKSLDEVNLKDIKKYYRYGHFPEGSMGPKILASIRFLESGGKKAIITNIENGWNAIQGKTGTTIIN